MLTQSPPLLLPNGSPLHMLVVAVVVVGVGVGVGLALQMAFVVVAESRVEAKMKVKVKNRRRVRGSDRYTDCNVGRGVSWGSRVVVAARWRRRGGKVVGGELHPIVQTERGLQCPGDVLCTRLCGTGWHNQLCT